jgi:hypothetical protein
MVRYHLIEVREGFQLLKTSISLEYAKAVRRRLWCRYPGRNFKIVSADVWDKFLQCLDCF